MRLTLVNQKTIFLLPYKDLKEQSKTFIHLTFRFEKKRVCLFLEKFDLYGDQLIFRKIVTLNQREVFSFYKGRYCPSDKCRLSGDNYDAQRAHNKRRNW